ncbi:MAG: flagellar basal body-associated protein FliL [Gammaproteobacteria bacterium]|jgi:flagellar FliL protein
MATKPAAPTTPAPNPGKPADPAAAEAPPPKGRGKKILIGLLAVTLLAGIGVGGWFYWQHSNSAEAKAAKAAATPPAPMIYYAMDPPFVANFGPGASARFLQIDLRVASRSPETIALMQANEPLLRNDLLLLFGAQDATALADRAGKDKLRTESLATVRRIVKSLGGKPESVDSVLFASFVMQ